MTARWQRWVALSAASVLLDVSLTFENIWPTPAVIWRGGLSIELAACVFAMAAASRWLGPPSTRALGWLTAVWTVLAIGRYAEVTAPALYGRDINLYWDLRFTPDVVAMVTRVAPLWLILFCVAAVAVILTILYRLLRAAWWRVGSAMADPRERRLLAVLSMTAIVLFIGQRVGAWIPRQPSFSTPVTRTYALQIAFVTRVWSAPQPLGPSPAMDSDLSRVRNADVFMVFIESYGAVSYERPEIAAQLAANRAQFDAAIRETNRDVVSAYVESPTFGGSSWLAHVSLLSGIEVRDPDANARLMIEERDTLVRAFGRRGFRTVAVMPGLRRRWPEGAFYGFDEIYGADRLAYRGPEFGWFAVPDQFSLDRLDALELNRPSRPPLFVFFPTISTHFPFSPTPPYQPDWRRMSTARPYDGLDLVRAYAREPDWTHFAPGYVEAMAYDFTSIGGYLRLHQDRDFVMILLGDHQPPAALTGEGASWDVPVHVVASRTMVLDRLVARGFREGLTPARPPIGRMHALLPLLLDAFGERDGQRNRDIVRSRVFP